MNVQTTMTTTAPATPAIITDHEIQDFELKAVREAKAPVTTASAKSNTVSDTAPAKPKTSTKPMATDEIIKAADGSIVIPPAIQKEMNEVASKIRHLHGKTVNVITIVGKHLINMKERLKHGEFAKWYESEFGWDAMTVNRYMKASRAYDSIRELEPTAKIDLLPPTLLYDFDKLSDDQQLQIADAAKAGRKVKAGDFRKTATSKKASASASASTDKDHDAAEALAKLIAGALPKDVAMKIGNHPGFSVPAFGELLSKEIAGSFTVSSNGGVA